MKLPYRGILSLAGLVTALLLLPQFRPLAQYSNPSGSPGSYATPSYSQGGSTSPSATPAPGYSPSATNLQSGPVGSFYNSSYLNFKVPVSLTGHSFALRYWNGANTVTGSASVGGVITTSAPAGGTPVALYLAVMAPPPGPAFNPATTDWWLADTTGPLEPASAHKTLDLINAAWITVGGSPNRYFAIPDTRAGHGLFAGFPQGGWSPVTAKPVVWTYYSGTLVSLHYFVGCATAMGGIDDAHLFLVDCNAHEKTPWGKTDVRAASDWTFDPSYTSYPTVPAHVTLEAREAGHNFTVHSQIAGVPEMLTSTVAQSGAAGTNTAVLDFQVGSGLLFWITRDAENGHPDQPAAPATGAWAAGTNPGVTVNQNAVGRFPAPPWRQAALVPHQFRVNASTRPSHVFSVRMSDGYTTIFSATPYHDAATDTDMPACGSETIAQWRGVPLSNPLPVITFTAMIDPTRAILLRDDSIVSGGGLAQDVVVDPTVDPTDVFDGWKHVNLPPPAPTITIRVPASRVNDWFQLFAQASPPAAFPWPTPPPVYAWPTPLPPLETITYSGVDGMADYAFACYTLTLANPTPYHGGPFTLQDMATLQPHDVSAGENDLRAWLKPESPVDLQISTSRTDHHLRLRHPNGEFFDITPLAAASNSTLGPGRTISNVPYYYFDATTHARSEMPWYVEDLDTGERIRPIADALRPTNDALIMWIAIESPTHLSALAGAYGITLAWIPGETVPGGGFVIERRESMNTGGPFTWWHELKRLPGRATTHRDTQLIPGEFAVYRVRAVFGDRRSAPTNLVRAAMWVDTDDDGIPDHAQPGDTGGGGSVVVDPPGGGGDGGDGGGGNPGIPGDGDGDGDPDNDKDGVLDINDRYPNDPLRSEDVPVKTYAALDLDKFIDVPLAPSTADPVNGGAGPLITIGDNSRVAWAGIHDTGSHDPQGSPIQAIRCVTWAHGVVIGDKAISLPRPAPPPTRVARRSALSSGATSWIPWASLPKITETEWTRSSPAMPGWRKSGSRTASTITVLAPSMARSHTPAPVCFRQWFDAPAPRTQTSDSAGRATCSGFAAGTKSTEVLGSNTGKQTSTTRSSHLPRARRIIRPPLPSVTKVIPSPASPSVNRPMLSRTASTCANRRAHSQSCRWTTA